MTQLSLPSSFPAVNTRAHILISSLTLCLGALSVVPVLTSSHGRQSSLHIRSVFNPRLNFELQSAAREFQHASGLCAKLTVSGFMFTATTRLTLQQAGKLVLPKMLMFFLSSESSRCEMTFSNSSLCICLIH